MVFHCLGIPYAPTRKEISLCAFVQKVYKFCDEMTKKGHTVYHYGHENSNVNCTEHVHVFNNNTLEESYGNLNLWKTQGFNQNVGAKAFEIFNCKAIEEIDKRLKDKNEFILCWFGYGHQACAEYFKDRAIIVEPSIGYDSMFAPIKIFETYAQMHKMNGMANKNVHFGREFVIYPGFDPQDFIYSEEKSNVGLFLGRIIESKGAKLAYDLCNHIGQEMIFAGPNILNLPDTKYCKFVGFVEPKERAELLSKAKFLFAPSLFVEPCNWTAIEAQFSGTPVICTDFGGFTETVVQNTTGIRCINSRHMIYAIQNIDKHIRSKDCREHVSGRFTLKDQMSHYEFLFESLIS